MVTNLKRTIVYICSICGKIKKFDINVFDFSGGNILYLKCGCGNSYMRIYRAKNGKYVISAPCAVCNEEHLFELDAKLFWSAPQITFGCPNSDFELFYCGTKEEMEDECLAKKEPMSVGEYFFENPFLSDVLNAVNLCEKKEKIKCGCGSDKICKNLFFDRVELLCQKCQSRLVVDAACENDVKNAAKNSKNGGFEIAYSSGKRMR